MSTESGLQESSRTPTFAVVEKGNDQKVAERLPKKGRYVKAKELSRLKAADNFVKHLHFMLCLGLFESLDLQTKEGRDTRAWIGEFLAPWEDIVYPEKGQ